MDQKIAFLYLSTGGGHRAPARALSECIQGSFGDSTSCVIKDVFEKKVPILRFFFETGYLAAANYFNMAWVFTYRFSNIPFVFNSGLKLIRPFIVPILVDFIRKEKITKIVCLHGLLTRFVREAINRVNPQIPLITVVLDPFTAHYYWFSEKKTDLVVFSSKVYREAVHKYGFSPERVFTYPLILSKKFSKPYTALEKAAVRRRMGIRPDEHVLLIAGGGEGLKNAGQLVKAFIALSLPYRLFVVCGKNKLLKMRLDDMVAAHQKGRNITVYGFVDFMPDLMNVADCVISKCGASIMMETLQTGKPLIISDYIRGQELGNMLYVTQKKVGWFLPNPYEAMKKAAAVLTNIELQKEITRRIAALHIRNGLDDICRFIVEQKI